MASSSLSCTICVDNFENSGDLCSTVCGHVFHFSCLKQWQERSNTCPLCNQSNPQPHRLFLDLPATAQSKTDNDGCSENAVYIKGIQAQRLGTTLPSIVLNLAGIMRITIRQTDIKDISRKDNILHVTFNTERHVNMFMENKFKLKTNPQTNDIVIHEVIDDDTKELFHHAHKLKSFGYNIIFVRNKKIYAKKDKTDQPINISSMEQVDSLCGKTRNTRPNQLTIPAVKTNQRNSVPSLRSFNAAPAPHSLLPKRAVNATHRNTVTTPARPPIYAPTAPSSYLANIDTNAAHLNTVNATASASDPLEHMDSVSANLIRQIIMEDRIQADRTNSQNRDRLLVLLPQTGAEQERGNNLRRDNQSNKSFKKSIESFFKNISSKFK